MFAAEPISYQNTLSFSNLVVDYVAGSESLHSFYAHPPTIEGVKSSIEKRKDALIDRKLLAEVFINQYQNLAPSEAVNANIQSLTSDNTFTICTAHQPNLLTGPLYFVYKIVHAIKLAAELQKALPQYHFVPVYYMGCEDADLQELNHFTVRGKKYVWNTRQGGAVGRMKVDEELLHLLTELEGQLGVERNGKEIMQVFKTAYTKGVSIQDATAKVVHHLFQKYGLLILNPDEKRLKEKAVSMFENDLFTQSSAAIVNDTSGRLNKHYQVQAYPRDINLFYLKDDIRQRFIKKGSGYAVHDTDFYFTEEHLKEELKLYPERFSPNVILRGVFQEMILPNIAFIGGGGELAYWLQLKDLFEHYAVPFPVLVLRNSFLIVEKEEQILIDKLNFSTPELFMPELEILNMYIQRLQKVPQLNSEVEAIKKLYDEISSVAGKIDSTLIAHVLSIKARVLKQLVSLEKKMLKAERRKHAEIQQQIHKLKNLLFPGGGLQERVENFSSYYAAWGHQFIDGLLQNSLSLEQQFTVLKELER